MPNISNQIRITIAVCGPCGTNAAVVTITVVIYGARTIEGLARTALLAMLPAHAGEIYSNDSGDYLLSVFHPENGVSIARLKWENDLDTVK